MQNLDIVRTAALVALAAALMAAGVKGMQGDQAQIAPELVPEIFEYY